MSNDRNQNHQTNANEIYEIYERIYSKFAEAMNTNFYSIPYIPEHTPLYAKYMAALNLFKEMPDRAESKEILTNDTQQNKQLILRYANVLFEAKRLVETENPTRQMLSNYNAAAKQLPHSASWKVKQGVWTFGMTVAAIACVLMLGIYLGGAPVSFAIIAVAVVGLMIAGFSKLISNKKADVIKHDAKKLGKTVAESIKASKKTRTISGIFDKLKSSDDKQAVEASEGEPLIPRTGSFTI